jgi:hypothetical protein
MVGREVARDTRASAMVAQLAQRDSMGRGAGVWVCGGLKTRVALGKEGAMGGQDVRTIEGSGGTLASNTLNSAVTYKIEDCYKVAFQLDGPSWPSGLVVSVEISNSGTTFFALPDGAITYTRLGTFQTINTDLWKWIRLRVSTTGGNVTITPIARGSVVPS